MRVSVREGGQVAHITAQRVGELLKALFEILRVQPDGIQAGEALERLARGVTLTLYEAGTYERTRQRRFENIIRLATIDCVKAGWLVKHKGTWTLTEAGLAASLKYADPGELYREALRLYRAWKASQSERVGPNGAGNGADAERAETSAAITFEQAEEQSWKEIERCLLIMNPFDFQHMVAGVLRAMGYHVSWISSPGKDGGVDIVAFNDPLGTRPPRIKVQVKRVSQKVDAGGLKSFVAIVNDDDVGLYVSSGGFTRDAEEFARNQERRKITLIDLERLLDLWIEFYPKLDESARRRLPLTPIYFLTPEA